MIRQAQLHDLESMLQIERKSFPHPWTHLQLQHGISGQNGNAALVLENPLHELVGYLVYQLIVDEAFLHNIAVHPQFRHQGLAAKLIRAYHRIARKNKCLCSLLEVDVENQEAQQCYIRLGYTEIGRRTKYYPNGNDAMVMKKKLYPLRTSGLC
jgi:ribosomal-protein-alanine N-acetyltransferase